LQWYTAPTVANEPAIKLNSRFFATNLKAPKLYDFIAFETDQQKSLGNGKFICIYRLMGLPGNVVQLKKGVLYIDGKNADANLKLKHAYKVSSSFAASLNIDIDNNFYSYDKDSGYVNLLDEEASKAGLTRSVNEGFDAAIKERFNKGWTIDNFGPVTVPAAHYFVLGDNRHSASDSRFIGFIPIADVKGTVINR